MIRKAVNVAYLEKEAREEVDTVGQDGGHRRGTEDRKGGVRY